MSKISIVYWSGTGNTEQMAKLLAEGIKSAGGESELREVDEVTPDYLSNETVFALGCPSMGSEQLEEGSMEPFVTELEGSITGKKIALFGSYGWGNEEWMRDWEERLKNAGATIVGEEGVTVLGEPDEDCAEKLKELGRKLVEQI